MAFYSQYIKFRMVAYSPDVSAAHTVHRILYTARTRCAPVQNYNKRYINNIYVSSICIRKYITYILNIYGSLYKIYRYLYIWTIYLFIYIYIIPIPYIYIILNTTVDENNIPTGKVHSCAHAHPKASPIVQFPFTYNICH